MQRGALIYWKGQHLSQLTRNCSGLCCKLTIIRMKRPTIDRPYMTLGLITVAPIQILRRAIAR